MFQVRMAHMKDHSHVLHDTCQICKHIYAGEISFLTQYTECNNGQESFSKLCLTVSNEGWMNWLQ